MNARPLSASLSGGTTAGSAAGSSAATAQSTPFQHQGMWLTSNGYLSATIVSRSRADQSPSSGSRAIINCGAAACPAQPDMHRAHQHAAKLSSGLNILTKTSIVVDSGHRMRQRDDDSSERGHPTTAEQSLLGSVQAANSALRCDCSRSTHS